MMESSIATVSAWPKWRYPVTLGGGKHMTYGFFSPFRTFSGLALKKFCLTHHLCQNLSTIYGLYASGILVISFLSFMADSRSRFEKISAFCSS